MIVNGLTLLKREKAQKRAGTGCSAIDEVLRGGLRPGTITEVYGNSGSGKTQFCLQVAVACCQRGVVYVSTEAFPTRRLQQMLEASARRCGVAPDSLGDHIYIQQIADVDELQHCLRVQVPALLCRRRAALLVLDSMAAPFRVAYDNYSVRAQHMREVAMCLLQVGREHSMAVLCVNQVTAAFSSEYDSEPVPSLGLSWANMVSTRLRISKTNVYIAPPMQEPLATNHNKTASDDSKKTGKNEKNMCKDKTGKDHDKIGEDYSKTGEDYNKTGEDYNKISEDNNKIYEDYNKTSEDNKRTNIDYSKTGEDYNMNIGCIATSERQTTANTRISAISTNLITGDDCKTIEDCRTNEEYKVSANMDCIVRSLKVIFAPDLPNSEVNFVVTNSGIQSVNL